MQVRIPRAAALSWITAPVAALLTICDASVVLAQDVCSELRAVARQAESDFDKLKGPVEWEARNSNRTRWTSNKTLPGADSCLISDREGDVAFYCEWVFDDQAGAGAGFQSFAAALAGCARPGPVSSSPSTSRWELRQTFDLSGVPVVVKARKNLSNEYGYIVFITINAT